MEIFSDTFYEELLLLLIDKLFIAAIIAAIFIVYDRWKTRESRKYQEHLANEELSREKRRTQVQLEFERARLIKDVMPVIQNEKIDIVTRAYVLRSAVSTNAIDADAAFEIGQDFLHNGLYGNHYKRIITATLPKSIGEFSRRGEQISKEWYDTFHYTVDLDLISDPESEKENPFINEGKLLRAVLLENINAFDNCICPEITEVREIYAYLPGLFVLTRTYDRKTALQLSQRPETAFQILGMIHRLLIDRADEEASIFLEDTISQSSISEDNSRLSRIIVEIMRWSTSKNDGYGSTSFIPILALVATGNIPTGSIEERNLHWLRWEAAEALVSSGENANYGEQIIQKHLEDFYQKLEAANTADLLSDLAQKYQRGGVISPLVSSLRNINSDEAKDTLNKLLFLDEEKLRYFPLLHSQCNQPKVGLSE